MAQLCICTRCLLALFTLTRARYRAIYGEQVNTYGEALPLTYQVGHVGHRPDLHQSPGRERKVTEANGLMRCDGMPLSYALAWQADEKPSRMISLLLLLISKGQDG